MKIDWQLKDIDKLLAKHDPKIIKKAAVTAVKRAGKSTASFISQQIRARYALKKQRVDKALRDLKKTYIQDKGVPTQFVIFEGRRISLRNYNSKLKKLKVSPKTRSYKRRGQWGGTHTVRVKKRKLERKGVTVKLLKTGSRKLVAGGFFGISPKNKVELIFKRKPGSKKLKALYGPAIPQMIHDEKAVINFANDRAQKEFSRAVNYFLSR